MPGAGLPWPQGARYQGGGGGAGRVLRRGAGGAGSDNRPCVQTSPPAFMGILLGDVLFRSLVVQFDLTHPTVRR